MRLHQAKAEQKRFQGRRNQAGKFKVKHTVLEEPGGSGSICGMNGQATLRVEIGGVGNIYLVM